MSDSPQALVLDLVEWIARESRSYREVIEAWRTSCPRMTIWEDAVDDGYVIREAGEPGVGTRIRVTPAGEAFLRRHGRNFDRTRAAR